MKVAKIQIVKPIDIEWNQFNKLLYTLQKETRKIMNKTIQYCWEYSNFSSDYKDKHGEYPKEKEILDYSLGGYIYNKLKEDTILYSANNSQSQQRAIKKWKSDSKEIYTGERSVPNFKRDVPLDLHNKSLLFYKDESNGNYVSEVKLLNRQGMKETEIDSSAISLLLAVKDNSTKSILERVISSEYKIGGSQIVKHKTKNKWFINLTYDFKKELIKLNNNNILGIDLGFNIPAYLYSANTNKSLKIEGDELTHFRKTVEKRRNELLRQGKYCGDGRIGHGRQTRIKPIEKLRGKVENFKATTNHKYSRTIIDFAIKNGCGTIQMEDLSGISADEKKSTFLGGWTYYDLQSKIEYKAKENGIEVVKVKPKYTSARCSKCGFIHRSEMKSIWRPKQEQFKCMKCNFGHEHFVNADWNAARNLAVKNIDKVIEEQLKKQEEEYKNSLKYSV